MEKQGPRVLLVDDEESIQKTLSVVLPTAGYTVIKFATERRLCGEFSPSVLI
jgi:FixJ family two-component response regulator